MYHHDLISDLVHAFVRGIGYRASHAFPVWLCLVIVVLALVARSRRWL